MLRRRLDVRSQSLAHGANGAKAHLRDQYAPLLIEHYSLNR